MSLERTLALFDPPFNYVAREDGYNNPEMKNPGWHFENGTFVLYSPVIWGGFAEQGGCNDTHPLVKVSNIDGDLQVVILHSDYGLEQLGAHIPVGIIKQVLNYAN